MQTRILNAAPAPTEFSDRLELCQIWHNDLSVPCWVQSTWPLSVWWLNECHKYTWKIRNQWAALGIWSISLIFFTKLMNISAVLSARLWLSFLGTRTCTNAFLCLLEAGNVKAECAETTSAWQAWCRWASWLQQARWWPAAALRKPPATTWAQTAGI